MSTKPLTDSENQIGDYLLNSEIGSGGFAKVVQGIHIPTGEKVAIKIMDKKQIFSEPLNLNRIQREIAILKIVRHKNIVKLYELMETPQKIYLVMEYCNGGELFDYIVKKQHLSEIQACYFFHEIINALEYLHSLNIVHRDIKPENLLLEFQEKKITLKLIDFGISNCYTCDKLLTTPCGTASYAPPEMHNGIEYYGLLSDVWSAGVVLYAMVFGYLPFCEEDEDTNVKNIINGKFDIPDDCSPLLKDLLLHLLDINPLTRYDLEEIKKHKWFNIVKNYHTIPGVIEGYHRIPIDKKVVEECQNFGYDKKKIIDSVAKCKYNRYSAVYYIILSKFKREGYDSISDLCSNKFLEYINDIDNIVYSGNSSIDNGEVENDKKKEKFKDKKKISRHKSHNVKENGFEKFLNDNDKKNVKHYSQEKRKQKNNMVDNNVKEIKDNDTNNNYYTTNVNTNMNTKNNSNKSNAVVYTKPKMNSKKNRNDKRNKLDITDIMKHEKPKTIFDSNNNLKNSLKRINVETSFNQNKYKKTIPTPNKNKKPNNSLKKRAIRENFIKKKLISMNSYQIFSKTKDILFKINDNENIKIDYLNASFNKKLSDDLKEKILKLKNPKQKIPQKQKKINQALLDLKIRQKKNKNIPNNNNNYNNNSFNKNTNRLKNNNSYKVKKQKIKLNYKPVVPILKENRQEHTIIHNRNASVGENRKFQKNMCTDSSRRFRDFSLSPKNHQINNNNNNYNGINKVNGSFFSVKRNGMNINSQNKLYNNNNLITKNNCNNIKKIIQKDNDFQQQNNYMTNQNNNNNYLNTTNISYSNRKRKFGFKTPNKAEENNMRFNGIVKKHIMGSNSTNKNRKINNIKYNGGRPYSQPNNQECQEKYIRIKNSYNKSYNNSYNKQKKSIRITFRHIHENENNSPKNVNFTNFNNSNKINSYRKDDYKKKIFPNNIYANNNKVSNGGNYNNNKYYHYKSRSMMDIENIISMNKNNNTNNYKHNNNNCSNYYNDNNNGKLVMKISSTKFASTKKIENEINGKKNFANNSYMNLRYNNSMKNISMPRKYRGPVDMKSIIISPTVTIITKQILNMFKKNNINSIKIGPFKFKCNKNGSFFDLEIFTISDKIIKIKTNNFYNDLEVSYYQENENEIDDKYRTIGGSKNSEKNAKIYYITVLPKTGSNSKFTKYLNGIMNKILKLKFNEIGK